MVDDAFVDVIASVVGPLEQVGIPYAITGSIASGVHGEPLPSQDVDIVARMTLTQAQTLADRLPPRFYRSRERLEDVARSGGLANLIDTDTGLKIDLSVPHATPFFDSALNRRMPVRFGPDGPSFFVVTPEDVILMKLLWRRDTRSEKQWRDVLSVARVQGTKLDWSYLFGQAEALDIQGDLTQLRNEAGI